MHRWRETKPRFLWGGMAGRLSALVVLSLLLVPMGSSLSAEDSAFDFETWKGRYGGAIRQEDWTRENPMTHLHSKTWEGSEFNMYTRLGPLGVTTLDYGRGSAPKGFLDAWGRMANGLEVIQVRRGAPAEGHLQEGDVIIAIDGETLLLADQVVIGREVTNQYKRQSEIHAGLLVDRAEGRGRISLTVLRAPGGKRKPYDPIGRDAGHVFNRENRQTLRREKVLYDRPVGRDDRKVSFPVSGPCFFRVYINGKKSGYSKFRLGGVFDLREVKLVKSDGTEVIRTNIRKKYPPPFSVPPGAWRFEMTLESRSRVPVSLKVTSIEHVLPKALEPYTKTVTFDIPRIGSFGDRFDPRCGKARNYSRILAHRLALSQIRSNGSWWVAGGRGIPHFWVSMCGLGLLSTGDPRYEENIRKAAYYVAVGKAVHPYVCGTCLIFLGEYYLRTRDRGILPYVRRWMDECEQYILPDYMIGHSKDDPGYGGRGWVGGSGVVLTGLALGCDTPVGRPYDRGIVDHMLRRLEHLAPLGKVPYDRGDSTDRQMAALSEADDDDVACVFGQSGSCSTGPYVVASMIAGGPSRFLRAARERYSTPPWGDADGGHSSQSLHFFWGILSSANFSDQAFVDSMGAYLWNLTLNRDFDGFVNSNRHPLEYHGGDLAIGYPTWRTAAYLVILNAHRRNLAITGMPECRRPMREFPESSLQFYSTLNSMLRSWDIAESALGEKAPADFRDVHRTLSAMKTGFHTTDEIRAVMGESLPVVLGSISRLPGGDFGGIQKGQILELVGGTVIHLSTPEIVAESGRKGKKTREEKRAGKEKQAREKGVGKNHQFLLMPRTKLQSGTPDGKKTPMFPVSNFRLRVENAGGAILDAPVSFQGPLGEKTAVFEFVAVPSEPEPVRVHVEYDMAGTHVSYDVSFELPVFRSAKYESMLPALNRFPVRCTPLEDFHPGMCAAKVVLKNGRIVGLGRNEAFRFDGPALLCGWEYELVASAAYGADHAMYSSRILKKDPSRYLASLKPQVDDPAALSDLDRETGLDVKADTVVLLKSPAPVTPGVAYLVFLEKGRRSNNVSIEAKVGGQWHPLAAPGGDAYLSVAPFTSGEFRLTFQKAGNGGRLVEIFFLTSGSEIPKPEGGSW
jgi:hypothetical protein